MARDEVRILEGGLPKWIKEGRPLETGAAQPKRRAPSPRASTKASSLRSSEVREALASGSAQVVDARPADRFRGEAPEPRPGLRSGHMPGSLNLPFVDIVEHGRLKPPEALKAVFAEHQVDLEKPIITTCGSGVTRRDPGARGRGGRRQGRGPLRRLVGGMGLARRLPGRDRASLSGGGANKIARTNVQ